MSVLVLIGYYDKKYHTLGGLKNKFLFLRVLEVGSPRPSCQQTQCLVRTHFLIHRWCYDLYVCVLPPKIMCEISDVQCDTKRSLNPGKRSSCDHAVTPVSDFQTSEL